MTPCPRVALRQGMEEERWYLHVVNGWVWNRRWKSRKCSDVFELSQLDSLCRWPQHRTNRHVEYWTLVNQSCTLTVLSRSGGTVITLSPDSGRVEWFVYTYWIDCTPWPWAMAARWESKQSACWGPQCPCHRNCNPLWAGTIGYQV